MKSSSRVKLAATLGNSPSGHLVLRVEDFDGGEFGLETLTDENSIMLPNATQPRYELSIVGSNPAALKRLANALNTLARNQESANGDAPAEDDDNA